LIRKRCRRGGCFCDINPQPDNGGVHDPFLVFAVSYIGAVLALAGAAVAYQSLPLLGHAAAFLLLAYLFVLWYEEPALQQTFGDQYQLYSARVSRW
jgi:tellurite resistance protein TehA-like permease